MSSTNPLATLAANLRSFAPQFNTASCQPRAGLRRPSDAGAEFETSAMQPLSPRPHEQPSGYRAWYVLKLGEQH
eukprot:1714381-Rhodomonas_salina.1